MDYEKEAQFLPPSMRMVLSQNNRITATVETSFLRLFQNDDALAVRNNYEAYEVSSGYVLSVHNGNLTTGLAPRLSDALTAKICGMVGIEGPDIDYMSEGADKVAAFQNNDIKAYKKAFSEIRLTKLLKEAYGDSIDSGRGTIFLNCKNGLIQTRVFNCFRCKLTFDSFGDIIDAKAFIMVDNQRAFEDWILTEHRYFKNNIPYQKYIITKSSWGDSSKPDSVDDIANYDELPDRIKKIYEEFPLYKEQELEGFVSLGVYPINNTLRNRKHKYSRIPESQFINVQDLLIERDITETQKMVEQNIGRGRIVLPTFMNTAVPSMGMTPKGQKYAIAGGQSYLDKSIFTQYESKSLDDCKPTNVQFDFRAEQWRSAIAGTVGDICSAFGMTILDIDPRYLQSGQRTDDEMNAMTDITSATVRDKRENNTEVINQMLNQIAVCLGIKTPVFIRWSMISIMNPSKNEDLITKQLSNGTISRRTAIKRSNPDYTDEEVEEELKRITEERSAAMPTIDFEEEPDEGTEE